MENNLDIQDKYSEKEDNTSSLHIKGVIDVISEQTNAILMKDI